MFYIIYTDPFIGYKEFKIDLFTLYNISNSIKIRRQTRHPNLPFKFLSLLKTEKTAGLYKIAVLL